MIIRNVFSGIARFVLNVQRPSGKTNARLLRERGESIDTILIRRAEASDVPELAALHVKTWNETYPLVKQKPSLALREHQWREQFANPSSNWFCILLENRSGNLIGFTKAIINEDKEEGEVNKIYLLKEYHRLGLGKKLFSQTAGMLADKGIQRVVLFGVPQNPSCYFHEAMGGKRMVVSNGEFHGGYYWDDISSSIKDKENEK